LLSLCSPRENPEFFPLFLLRTWQFCECRFFFFPPHMFPTMFLMNFLIGSSFVVHVFLNLFPYALPHVISVLFPQISTMCSLPIAFAKCSLCCSQYHHISFHISFPKILLFNLHRGTKTDRLIPIVGWESWKFLKFLFWECKKVLMFGFYLVFWVMSQKRKRTTLDAVTTNQ